ncbi:flavodoxin [Budviciaceae bacterium CWB-B4]|uniref:Flavodoxin n=1 Tax=Limnobaculum xujianqingii TaxID=2738837 RepID=A0A9D7FX30_9GAMM|nr:flavodoxin [Limnobaculum xujianqingii]MBK5072661.1 flavodoxin [Limnobaculum xujianqingii]MBK5175970.1 flavodoxin [Limnobaculum xujianqingii]
MKKIFILLLAVTFSSLNAIAEPVNSHAQRTLIVYFSQPENVKLDGVDGISGASILQKNGQISGSTQYLAQIIQRHTGGELFRIETVTPYPTQHEPLLRYAEQEQRDNRYPELKTKIDNLADYDRVFIGYPIWWYKMPMPLYSFLQQHDLSGKTLIPFTSHGGSRFSDSLREIKRLQPDARLVTQGLAISRDDVADDGTVTRVGDWLNKLTSVQQ